jgi:hypothetical protein
MGTDFFGFGFFDSLNEGTGDDLQCPLRSHCDSPARALQPRKVIRLQSCVGSIGSEMINAGTAPMVSVYVMITIAEWRAKSRLFVTV